MQPPDIRGLSHMKLPNVNQIGILVPNIPEAVAYYTKLLNIGPWYRSNTVKHEVIYRGKPISTELDIVLAFQGALEIELIQVKHEEACVYSDMLKKSGAGIHHLGFVVSGYDKKLDQMKRNGIEVLQSGVITTRGSAITRYAYLDTIKQCGILSELIVTNLRGLRMPHRKFIMEIGCITGDVERVKV
jgi:catechol 2,3-dioxygenase-like lactoylglutathione lyase family enzyme